MKQRKGQGIRKRLSQEEADLVDQYRAIKNECESSGVNPEDVKHGWLKSDNASLFFTNPNYKDEAQTKETITEDGWLHTGDIGVMVEDTFLKITDRKKEIFKNSAGKYIAPQVIENIMKESSLIEQAMVVGENEKFASALISPNMDYLHFWASKHKVHFDDNKDLVQKNEIIARMQREINKVNKRLGQVEQIKRFRLVCDSWSPETGELSPTLKLKRKELYAKYDHILRDIYSVGDKI